MAKFRGGMPGMPGMGNMNNMIKQAQKMQAEMARIQQEAEEKTVEASAGGGAVTVVASCKKQIVSIKISPEAVDADDVETLEDLIMAATNEALRKAEETLAKDMSSITGGMNIPGLF